MMNTGLQMLLIVSILSFSHSQLVGHENHNVEIYFQCEDMCSQTSVTLQIGNRNPFYQSGNISHIGLRPAQKKRFQVHQQDSPNLNNKSHTFCHISISIRMVQKEDIGTYICFCQKIGEKDKSPLSRIWLDVLYPPGKACCEVGRHNTEIANEWLLLHCVASMGSHLGKFHCYQNGRRVPPWTKLEQHYSTMQQSLWMETSHPVFCCTMAHNVHKSMCECNDFKWDPLFERESNKTVDPCPATTISTQTDILSYNKASTIGIFNYILSEESKLSSNDRIMHVHISIMYIIFTLFTTVTMIMILLLLKVFCRNRRYVKNNDTENAKSLKEQHTQTSPPTNTTLSHSSDITKTTGQEVVPSAKHMSTEDNFMPRNGREDSMRNRGQKESKGIVRC